MNSQKLPEYEHDHVTITNKCTREKVYQVAFQLNNFPNKFVKFLFKQMHIVNVAMQKFHLKQLHLIPLKYQF